MEMIVVWTFSRGEYVFLESRGLGWDGRFIRVLSRIRVLGSREIYVSVVVFVFVSIFFFIVF